uniref:Uncharacterized protein n=1 Tax=Anguilla anguilla TaxID=7936 RepID=A0A0E9SJ08_ANGAN
MHTVGGIFLVFVMVSFFSAFFHLLFLIPYR